MDREEALKLVATHGYNVGYGAKKHFATLDIVEKVPGAISFISIAFGILSLKYFNQELESHVSVALTIFGVISLYISFYLNQKDAYQSVGNRITQIFSELQSIYLTLKSDSSDVESEVEKARVLMNEFYSISIPKQILLSDWYTHYKFFVQTQIDWIDEQKKFKLLKDKIPRSFQLVVLMAVIYLIYIFTPELSLEAIKTALICE
ncbi:MAG: SLATT domain-containing protein [Pseudomonadales bacterium]